MMDLRMKEVWRLETFLNVYLNDIIIVLSLDRRVGRSPKTETMHRLSLSRSSFRGRGRKRTSSRAHGAMGRQSARWSLLFLLVASGIQASCGQPAAFIGQTRERRRWMGNVPSNAVRWGRRVPEPVRKLLYVTRFVEGERQSVELPDDDDVHRGDGVLISETFTERYADHLPSWLLDRCQECGWTYPTRIQERALDVILQEGRDVIVQAETGSGKTLAYLLPCLAGIDPTRSAVQALIVVPTRELGMQVARVAKRLAAASSVTTTDDYGDTRTQKIAVMSVLQGSQNRRQRAWAWAEPPHVVIGTPRELCNMIGLGGIKKYNSVKYVVVDEVDACLLNNAGRLTNQQSVNNLLSSSSSTALHELLSKYLSPTYDDGSAAAELDRDTPMRPVNKSLRPVQRNRQTVFCSATIPQVRHFLKQCVQNHWMINDPVHVSLKTGEQHLPSQLQHAYLVCSGASSKLAALRRMMKKIAASSATEPQKVLIFADPSRRLEEIAKAVARATDGVVVGDTQAGRSAAPQSVISVLRFDDGLSLRAAAMDAFLGEDRSSYSAGTWSHLQDGNTSLRVLISTDLAARGLDVVDITHVVHMDLPGDADTYLHRSGRTGRARRDGRVISIITPDQEFVLQRLMNKLQIDDVKCIARQQSKDKKGSSKQ